MENNNLPAKLKVIFSAVAWGTVGLFVRYIDMPSGLIACARGFMGASFLNLVLSIKNKSFHLDFDAIKKNLLWLTVSGAAMGLNWVLLFEAYVRTSISIATLCYYMAPIIVMAVSVVLFKERLTPGKITCILIALVGMLMVSGVLSGNPGSGYGVSGMLLALGAAVLYATVTLSGKLVKGISSFDQTVYELFMAALILVPYNLIKGNLKAVSVTPRAVIMLIILGIVHTGVCMPCILMLLGLLRHRLHPYLLTSTLRFQYSALL